MPYTLFRHCCLSLILLFLLAPAAGAQRPFPIILNEQARTRVVNEVLEDRFQNLLPQLMRREGIDMWILISREYNEDPVMKTMLPAEWLSARRRTVMVFFDRGPGQELEKLAIARYDVGLLKAEWDLNVYPDQWEALVETVKARNPKKIGINTSDTYGLADGLVHTEYELLMKNLPETFRRRVVSAERLAVAWLETRTEKEMALYEQICRIGHLIVQEGLSEKAIQPGVTTTDDVVWWYRNRVRELGLDTWFHPTVDVQRADPDNFDHLRTFSKRPERQVILPGDLLHVDFGITYLRLNTDMQQHAYVLRPSETTVPQAIQDAFRQGNRLQDILVSRFAPGKTGNEVLAEALAQAKAEDINGSIYTHPIGFHGHAAGPAIGMWDNQNKVPGTGDYPLQFNTAFSIELNAAVFIPEWNKTIRIMLEEEGYFDESGFRFMDGRQEQIYTIPRR
ncbi:MAG: M24 family metallopeptidase [Saprospiraceae bacterium]|nr:M24 family metallopeptidase [Saprospiraceae bacterium]